MFNSLSQPLKELLSGRRRLYVFTAGFWGQATWAQIPSLTLTRYKIFESLSLSFLISERQKVIIVYTSKCVCEDSIS